MARMQPMGHIPGFHAPGTTVPIGYIMEQQALARSQAEVQYAAAAAAAAEAALRAEGATCAMVVRSTGARCDIPAFRRCTTCSLAYCRSHASRDQPAEVDVSAGRAVADLCVQCQEAARDAERETRRSERQRAETAAKERQERLEREVAEHAAEVVRHEAASGWAGAQKRVAWLTRRLSRSATIKEVSQARITTAVIIGFLGFLWAVATVTGFSSEKPSTAALSTVSVLALPLVGIWLLWTFWLVRRQNRLAGYRRELESLERGRGCGEKSCRRCAQVRL